jgi:biotin carboxyl carrier protein
MLKVKLNNKSYEVWVDGERPIIDGSPLDWDIVRLSATSFHILFQNKSYSAEIVQHDTVAKTIALKINGQVLRVEIKDRYDLLLEKMGMTGVGVGVVSSVKAPMPGLIVKISVQVGDAVKPGDALLVLEAMKMENMIKASAEAKVSQIKTKKGDSVEKGQVLIEFQV